MAMKKSDKQLLVLGLGGIVTILGGMYFLLFADFSGETPVAPLVGMGVNSFESMGNDMEVPNKEISEKRDERYDNTVNQQREDSLLIIQKRRAKDIAANVKVETDLSYLTGEKPAPAKSRVDNNSSVANSGLYSGSDSHQSGHRKAGSSVKKSRSVMGVSNGESAPAAVPATEGRRRRSEGDIVWGGENAKSDAPKGLTFEAIVHGDQLVKSGESTRITVRTIQDVPLGSCVIPANKILTATVHGSRGDRVYFRILAPCGDKKYFDVYDQDGERGLFVETTSNTDNVKKKQIANLAGNAMNALAQAAGGGALAGTINNAASSLGQEKLNDYSIVMASGKKLVFILTEEK